MEYCILILFSYNIKGNYNKVINICNNIDNLKKEINNNKDEYFNKIYLRECIYGIETFKKIVFYIYIVVIRRYI